MRKPKTQSIMRPAALLLFLTMCFIYLYVLVGLPMKGSIPLPFIVVANIKIRAESDCRKI